MDRASKNLPFAKISICRSIKQMSSGSKLNVYRSDWADFLGWTAAHRLCSLPAEPSMGRPLPSHYDRPKLLVVPVQLRRRTMLASALHVAKRRLWKCIFGGSSVPTYIDRPPNVAIAKRANPSPGAFFVWSVLMKNWTSIWTPTTPWHRPRRAPKLGSTQTASPRCVPAGRHPM